MSAPVWEYFKKISAKNNADNKAKCNKCSTEVNNSKGSTSAMINHMRNVHKICIKRKEVESADNAKEQSQKSIDFFIKKPTLEEIVTELATKDGFSIRGITRSAFIRQAISDKGFKLPKSENGTMALIHAQYEKIKEKYIFTFTEAKKKDEKFSITLDEWVSTRHRRYMNINLHDRNGKVYNLGLTRIFGSCDAEKILSTVENHLKTFNISFKKDIVATTNDGASVMVKYGKNCPAEVQLCLNHAIHLGVCDTFYSKKRIVNNVDSDDENEIENESYDENQSENEAYDENEIFSLTDDFNSEEGIESSCLSEILNKVRAIVKFFKYSTLRNDILQKKVSEELGKELQLILDVKHRWNSIHPMLDTFMKIKNPIKEALEELNSVHLILEIDLEAINELCSIMEPILLTVQALSRKDANLITAKGAVNFLLRKFENAAISNLKQINDLKENIKNRLNARQNTDLNSLLSCLMQQNVPTKETLNFGTNLVNRLFPKSTNENQCDVIMTDIHVPITLEEEINESINDAAKEAVEKEFSSLREEFNILKKTGKKTAILQKMYDAILSVRPTSTESERAFSISANFSRKLRTRLSDYSLNCLVFLKYNQINN